MGNILFFSRKELLVIVAVGAITGILDDRIEMLEFAFVAHNHTLLLVNDYLAYVTGGPVFGDILLVWLEFGAVLAACLVRKPAAGTVALTVNGFFQVFLHGTHDPHLLYGVPGLGADVVFAFFRYRRYDLPAVCLAGIACAMFWYPVVWFTHGLYAYPLSFILTDLAFRVFGGAIGDGLMGAAIALAILRLAGRRWDEPRALGLGGGAEATRLWYVSGFLTVSVGVLLIVITRAVPSVSSFFASVGPKISGGVPSLEEYNPGYVIGVVLIFLALTMLAFWNLRSRYADERQP